MEENTEPVLSAPQIDAFSRRTLIEGMVLGAVYGLFFRLGTHFNLLNSGTSMVMTMAFLFGGPMVMGYITVSRATSRGRVPVWQWFVLPWGTVVITMVAAMLLYLEGSICVIFALPFALVGASIGGMIAGVSSRYDYRSSRSMTMCVLLLPVLIAPVESRFDGPIESRTVSSEIRIHARDSVIWSNIERVSVISPAELHTTWAQRIGFPRPVEATLSYDGVGGVRHASFERGLLFIETVTAWEPQHRLAFSIRADTANIPPTTLDEHVTIGGRYFDVLNGEYRLEPLPNGDILLRLTSRQRLSTDFNGYAGLWTDAVMQSLQTSILQVIQHRCEAAKK